MARNTSGLKPPWKKGDPSPNPGGQPKGKRITTFMAEIGQLDKLPKPKTLCINGQLAIARIKKALTPNGDRAAEIIIERTEGPLDRNINLKTDGILNGKSEEQIKDILKRGLENG